MFYLQVLFAVNDEQEDGIHCININSTVPKCKFTFSD